MITLITNEYVHPFINNVNKRMQRDNVIVNVLDVGDKAAVSVNQCEKRVFFFVWRARNKKLK